MRLSRTKSDGLIIPLHWQRAYCARSWQCINGLEMGNGIMGFSLCSYSEMPGGGHCARRQSFCTVRISHLVDCHTDCTPLRLTNLLHRSSVLQPCLPIGADLMTTIKLEGYSRRREGMSGGVRPGQDPALT